MGAKARLGPWTQSEPPSVAEQIVQRAHSLVDSGKHPTVDAALKAIFHSDPAAYQAWQNSLQVRVDAQSVGTASANALAQTAYEGTVGQFVQMDWRDSGSMAEVWRHNSQLHAAWRQAVQLPNPSSVHVVTKTPPLRRSCWRASRSSRARAWACRGLGPGVFLAEGQALKAQYYGARQAR